MKLLTRFYLPFFAIFLSQVADSQYLIKGKVTDARNGESLPFVILQFKGTDIGGQTDFDGNYAIKVSEPRDSLRATYVGYKTKSKLVNASLPTQTINFQLNEDTKELGEVVVKRGENPAWEILRRINKNKDKNDKRSLKAYEYESYSKVQVDVDNISQKLRQRRILKKVIAAIDSMKKVTNDEGKAVIPIYISETISKNYYTNSPFRSKELMTANKIVGILDESNGNFISQLTGSSTTDFNFYQSYIRFLGKDFISPIAESWKDYYEYDLEDSLIVNGDFCYKINVKPKREADLAFKGTIWVIKNDYAIKRTDLAIGKSANLNFVEKIKVQQEMSKTKAGPYLASKVRFSVDLAEIADSSAGFIIKYYISNRNIVENKPKEETFFRVALETADTASQTTNDFWLKNRHDTLSEVDKRVYAMVDTIKHLPIVKSYIEIFDLIVNGYKKVGPIEFGNYIQALAVNDIEGLRLRMGARTNMSFSKNLQLRGFLAYGTNDGKFKYGLGFDYWFSKKMWFLVGGDYSYDLEQLAIFSNYRAPGTGLFYATARWGKVSERTPFYISNGSLYVQMDVIKGITPKIQFNYQEYHQVPDINPRRIFGYFDDDGVVQSTLRNADILFELRIARRERFLNFDHRRISIGNQHIPIVSLRYNLGLQGINGSDFSYHKFSINLYQKVTLGKFGQSTYSMTATYIPTVLPYPLLNIHLGNPTPVYNPVGFSMMRFFEFVSDKSLTINYQHHFNGLLFNRIPLFHKLKWREVVSCNAIWGTVNKKNQDLVPKDKDDDGRFLYRNFQSLNPDIPYVDAGAGIENIFRFIRIEIYRRLTYIENISEDKLWGFKIGLALSL
ncbi:MAG: DUF5686 family protein [Cytophagales bacterium]